ncbi:MAG: MoaD/ThiS family protein [Gemmatimonadaceae bacterium]|nr:MoaD/ThiS family protein [Gemmatimonadaceae bacterium]
MPDATTQTLRVVLPSPLRALASLEAEVSVVVTAPASIARVLDVVEHTWPMLRGTIRDHGGGKRRAFVRFYACGRDLSHDPVDSPLPAAVQQGDEPLLVVGAMAGG